MRQPESVFQNETHRMLWDYEIKTGHQIPARRHGSVIINKKKREIALL